MKNQQNKITLNNGIEMPALGLGVFRAQENETQKAVEGALENKYRLIDTASIYGNEEQVGQAIKTAGIPREDLFITTKLWITDYGYDQALRAFDVSMKKLRLDYLDLYLLHWPTPSNFKNTIASWRAMEHIYEKGRIRAIGVCNFTEEHLIRLEDQTSIKPVVNQIELHPYFAQHDLHRMNTERKIITQAWSPIGGAMIYHPEQRPLPYILEHESVRAIGEQHGKSPAQVVLRWHLQHGRSVIPKSVHLNRIIENFNVFDFLLSVDEMMVIDKLDVGMRIGPDPNEYDVEYAENHK